MEKTLMLFGDANTFVGSIVKVVERGRCCAVTRA